MEYPLILQTKAKKYYEELYEIVRIEFEDGDEHLLAILANCLLTYQDAIKEYMVKGPIIPGDTMYRQNPAFGVVKETTKMIESLASHFGLSPKSRKQQFKIKDESEEDPVEAFKDKFSRK